MRMKERELSHVDEFRATPSLTGTDPDGNPLEMGSVTAEMVRRQEDGSWRFVIDNAWGDLAAGE